MLPGALTSPFNHCDSRLSALESCGSNCITTRHPEVMTLKNISPKTILPLLENIFLQFGIQWIIQSDMGN